jgi:membrane protein DedA with SNARE-associated domain
LFESFLAKNGYIAILLGTAFEGETIMIIGVRFVPGFRTIGGVAIGMSDVSSGRFTVLNVIGAVLWALIIGFLGYLCGHALELIMGEIKHLEAPILVGIAVIGGLWFFFNRRRRSKSAAIQNS